MNEWLDICSSNDLQPNAGVCALVQGKQIAIFFLPKESAVFALDNYDPFAKANVISRGLVGDVQGQLMVASPLYKQHYALQTGICLEDAAVQLATYPVRITADRVELCLGAAHETV